MYWVDENSSFVELTRQSAKPAPVHKILATRKTAIALHISLPF
jgi:hypothetical protein